MPRTVVIGDVHGCLRELDALLERVAPVAGDRLVLVGDLVAKGPASRGVVRRVRELGARAVMGNHDHRVVTVWAACRAGDPPRGLKPHHARAAAELDDEDHAFLAALPHHLGLPDVGVRVVHAGLVPGVPLSDQDPASMRTMRSLRPDGQASARIEDGVPWASRWPGPEHVVFGHDAVRGLQRHPHATGLDTGCVYGGALTALVLPSRELISVPAQRVWSRPS